MKNVEAGEMFGFKIVNTFPESSTHEEWEDFAEAMAKILDKKSEETSVSA